jgi:hypothetical protein
MRCDIWEEKIRRKGTPAQCARRGPKGYENFYEQRRRSLFGLQSQAPRLTQVEIATKMTTIYDLADTTGGGVSRAPDTANSHTSRRDHDYAALQQKFAEADAWPPQKHPPAKRKRRLPLPYGRRAP